MERENCKNESGHNTVVGVPSKVASHQCARKQMKGVDVNESRLFRSHLESKETHAKKRFPKLEFFSDTSVLSSSVGTPRPVSDTGACSGAFETVSRGSSTSMSQSSDSPINKEFIKNGGYVKLFSKHLRQASSQLSSQEHNEFMQHIKKLYENSEYATLYRD